MPSGAKPKRFKTFRVGPKNQRLLEPGESAAPDESGYLVVVDTSVPVERLAARMAIEIVVEDPAIGMDIFKYPDEGRFQLHFELFEFPKRADYGRNGVDEGFVRDRLDLMGFRPATFIELLCFGGYLRDVHKYDWFEGKSIVALGSVATTTRVVKKARWFWKPVTATFRHYPEFVCIAGRPVDQIKLTTSEKNRDGNWPNDALFLGVDLK